MSKSHTAFSAEFAGDYVTLNRYTAAEETVAFKPGILDTKAHKIHMTSTASSWEPKMSVTHMVSVCDHNLSSVPESCGLMARKVQEQKIIMS